MALTSKDTDLKNWSFDKNMKGMDSFKLTA